MAVRNGPGFPYISAIIRLRPVQVQGHACCRFSASNGFDLLHDFIAPPFELALELADKGQCAFLVHAIERGASQGRDCPPQCRHDDEHRGRKSQQQFSPKTQINSGVAPASGRLSLDSRRDGGATDGRRDSDATVLTRHRPSANCRRVAHSTLSLPDQGHNPRADEITE